MEWLDRILANENAVTLLVASVPLFIAVITWWLNEWARYRRDTRLRREKKTDVMRALRAEIEYFLESVNQNKANLVDFIIHFDERIKEALSRDPNYTPFVPSNRYDHVYNTFLPEIQVLPKDVIGPVVTFYSQVSAVQDFGRDMRDPKFTEIAQERKSKVFFDYIKLTLSAIEYGEEAQNSLTVEINKNNPGDSAVAEHPMGFGVFEFLILIAYFTILCGLLLYFQ